MLQLSTTTLTSEHGFDGLSQLRNYGQSKEDWLESNTRPKHHYATPAGRNTVLAKRGHHLEVRRGSFSRVGRKFCGCDDGTFARDIRLHQSSGLSVLAADGEHRSSISRRYGSADRPHDLRNWDINASAEEVCESAATMLRADYVDGGQMPVVLANRFGGVIFTKPAVTYWKQRRWSVDQPHLPRASVNPSLTLQ